MGKLRVRWIGPLVAVAIVAGAATGLAQLSDNFTNPAAPVPGPAPASYLVTKNPAITGGATASGHKGQISVLGLDFGANYNSLCSGLDFRKPTDQATPTLFNAAMTNQTIGTATFTEYRAAGPVKGSAPEPTLQIIATNSTVSIHHVDATTTGAYDDVTLTPNNVTIKWLAGPSSQHTATHFQCVR